MTNETKQPIISRAELIQSLQMVDGLLERLNEMRRIGAAILARPGEEDIEVTHREEMRLTTLRDEVGEMLLG